MMRMWSFSAQTMGRGVKAGSSEPGVGAAAGPFSCSSIRSGGRSTVTNFETSVGRGSGAEARG